ncbi:MAG TPA: endonuclease, partial [Flavobacterium sp.]|nr:endonuclease [Flavobacterium sp.]
LIQNGADAIAVYHASSADFPNGTLASSANLVDALAYGTNDPDASELMALLGLAVQYNEGINNLAAAQSIQRKDDGTYEVKTPTPGANNGGNSIALNRIAISTSGSQYIEGQSFNITFTAQNPVTSNLTFNFTLANGTFTAADYTGNTTVSIPAGGTAFTTTITLIDDILDEGEEIALIKFGLVPAGYAKANDNLEIRVLNNSRTASPWGTPLNPTYGIVANMAPAGYYAALEGKSGAILKQAVQDIIADPAVVRAHNYGDISNILKIADQNPLNSNEVWLMYKETGRSKSLLQGSGSGMGRWNREHIYPQSRGGFSDGTSSTADGINVWQPSSAAILAHGHADAHHLRAEDSPENSSRSNRDYGLSDYNGFPGNAGSWKGDVARAVFYMAVRYNGLDVVNGNPPDTTVGKLGDLATLLQWNLNDPADDFEMNRNNYIYTWQKNRNPFIDLPELASYIWGANAGQAFSLSFSGTAQLKLALYQNQAQNEITIAGIDNEAEICIFSISGQKLMVSAFSGTATLPLHLPPGIYIARIVSGGKTAVRKIAIR